VDCQWCFIAEDSDFYCIPYILTVKIHKTIRPITVYSLTLHTVHTHARTSVCKFCCY